MNILLLRSAEGDIGAAAVGAPTVGTGADAKPGIGEGDAFVDFFFVGVYFRTWDGIPDLPEIIDKFVPGFVCGKRQKPGALVLGDDVDDVMFQPFTVIFREFFFLLGRNRG